MIGVSRERGGREGVCDMCVKRMRKEKGYVIMWRE